MTDHAFTPLSNTLEGCRDKLRAAAVGEFDQTWENAGRDALEGLEYALRQLNELTARDVQLTDMLYEIQQTSGRYSI